jgi:hypothetical protein
MSAAVSRTVMVSVSVGVFMVCLMTWVPAGAVEVVTPTGAVSQGEVARIVVREVPAGSAVEGLWQGEPLGFFARGEGEYVSLLGIDLQMRPGTYPLEVTVHAPGNRPATRRQSVEIAAKGYGVEHLRLPEHMVTLDPATLKRVSREKVRFDTLWDRVGTERHWRGRFIRPVPGKLLAPFGRRRILNGEPRSPHSGVDLRAGTGEPVRAANNGRVALVGEFFFAGRSVVVDHGLGLYTMYFHLSRATVAEGDLVERGETIGLAGSTGRATGPHLHWGVRLNGARVDPLVLLEVTGSEEQPSAGSRQRAAEKERTEY